MRGEVVLFLPRAAGLCITDEHREVTYGHILTQSLGKPTLPHQRERFRFRVVIDGAGTLSCAEDFDDLAEAQAFAERFLRAQGALG